MNRLTRGRPLAALVAAALAAGLTACGSDPLANEDLTLTLAIPAASSFDFVNVTPDWTLGGPVFDKLWVLRESSFVYEPALAEEWAYNEDRTVLSIRLRPDVTDSEGNAFDAEALKQIIDARRASPLAPRTATLESVEVTGDLTVELHFSTYDPNLIRNFSADLLGSPAMLGKEDAGTNPIGTGAYVLDTERTVPDTEYVFVKRDDAWNTDDYPYDEIVMKVMGDAVARLNALTSGQVDGASIDAAAAGEAEAAGLERTVFSLLTWGIQFGDVDGTLVPALGDPRVRKAISHAFDREAINDALFAGVGRATNQPWRVGSPWYHEDREDEHAYDPDLARDLLAEAGYPDGFAVTVLVRPGLAMYEPIVQQSLADIGIVVSYEEPAEFEDFVAQAARQPMSINAATLNAILNDQLLPDGPSNWWKNTDPELGALIDTIYDGTATEEENAEAQAAVGDWMLDEQWYVTIGTIPVVWAHSPEIEVTSNPNGPVQQQPFIDEILPAR